MGVNKSLHIKVKQDQAPPAQLHQGWSRQPNDTKNGLLLKTIYSLLNVIWTILFF